MRTYRIVPEVNDRFTLGGRVYFLPHGEVDAYQICDELNLQAGPFLRFFVGAGEGVCYSHVNQDVKMIRGRVEL